MARYFSNLMPTCKPLHDVASFICTFYKLESEKKKNALKTVSTITQSLKTVLFFYAA